jgi:predicted NACHT family NTPase
MLPQADQLLQQMKQKVDALVFAPPTFVRPTVGVEQGESLDRVGNSAADLTNDTLHEFIQWVVQKSQAVQTSYQPAAVRAFYLTLGLPTEHRLARDQALALAIAPKLSGEVKGELALDLALTHALAVASALTPELIYDRLSALRLALELDHLAEVKPISDLLQQLKNQLPDTQENRESVKQWWSQNGESWVSQLRTAMIQHRHIGHEWHLNEASQHLLEQYIHANKLLVDCLNSHGHLTSEVRQEIDETLLLPSY